MNNRGRVIRQLKEVPPQAGRDIYLTLDLKLQQYIETLLAGSRAAVVVTDPRTGAILALVSTPAMTRTCSSTASPAKITPRCSTTRTHRWSTEQRRGSIRRRRRSNRTSPSRR